VPTAWKVAMVVLVLCLIASIVIGTIKLAAL
jgi:Na+-transporting NADH:ubiquinone oxidoreductase subunit NqrC